MLAEDPEKPEGLGADAGVAVSAYVVKRGQVI